MRLPCSTYPTRSRSAFLGTWALTYYLVYLLLICVPPGMCQGKVRLSSGAHSRLLPCLKMVVNVPASSVELPSRAPDKAV
ncbi:hypothetical protein NXS19_003156 [Fusarium pseudograminearum]|nr:hypothetical protein NXS19_003156 [Fusarium pseudograminearum]